jgi:uncharacterized surface protein with fasciclin (FAS1) repeats
MRSIKKIAAAVAVVSALGTTAACGSNDSGSTKSGGSTKSSSTPSSSTADPTADLVGPGCADYAKAVPNGGGSVAGMAQDPVAVAASNNPLLTTLVAAVSGKLNPKVNLVDTLNGGEFTVFAPVDDAFGKIDPATVNALKQAKNAPLLTKILTNHVVAGQILPSDIDGTQKTAAGETLKVSGSGDNITVKSSGASAKVICGGVHTANATVYLVDTVLLPKM